VACLMTPASWVPQKGRLASEERDGCARELSRGRRADMWVSPQCLIGGYILLSNYRIFTEAQNGFRKRKCIDTAIQSFIERIQETLDSGLHTTGILFDLTKTYSIWNHKILLEELYSCGIRGNMVSVFFSKPTAIYRDKS